MADMPMLEKSLMVPTVPVWRLSVEQYHRMIDAGILTADDPIELLEGWLVTKMAKNRPHSLATRLTREALENIMPPGWYVDTQEPITTADSEPEPDVIVVRGNPRDYTARQPSPAEVALVVEVADTTLQTDRTLKLRLYARAGIPVYWILNLPEKQLEAYSDPSAENATYLHQRVYTMDKMDKDVPVVIDGQEIARLKVQHLFA